MTAAGIKALRKIQLVKESAHGTHITTATARFIGKLDASPEEKYHRPEDYDTGRLSSFEAPGYVVGESVKLAVEAVATYEQLGYVLGMGVKGGVTASAPADSFAIFPNFTIISVAVNLCQCEAPPGRARHVVVTR